MQTLHQIIRTVLFLILAFFGLVMAFVLMASTALAIGVLYIIARLQGRPFGVRAYWSERRRAPMPPRPNTWNKSPARDKQDAVDIEMREIP